MSKQESGRQIATQLCETAADLADRGQLKDALAYYGRALEVDPKLSDALFQKGIVHLKLGWHEKGKKQDFADALQYFEKTLELNRHWKHVCSYVGDAHLMLGILGKNPKDNFAKAVNAYTAVLKLNLKAEPDLCGDGYALLELGKLEDDTKKRKRIFAEAESVFVKLLNFNPDDSYAVCGRGRALLELGLLEKEPAKRQELLGMVVGYGRDMVSLDSGSKEIRLFFGDLFSGAALGCDGKGSCTEAEFRQSKKAKAEGIPKFLVQRLIKRKEMRGLHQLV